MVIRRMLSGRPGAISRSTADLAVRESLAIGCPPEWCRELLAEAGYAMTDRSWRHYLRQQLRLIANDERRVSRFGQPTVTHIANDGTQTPFVS